MTKSIEGALDRLETFTLTGDGATGVGSPSSLRGSVVDAFRTESVVLIGMTSMRLNTITEPARTAMNTRLLFRGSMTGIYDMGWARAIIHTSSMSLAINFE